MNASSILSLIVLLAGLAVPTAKYASAQSQPDPGVVNLVGTWDIAIDELEFYDGSRGEDVNLDATITITEQSGSILRGQVSFTIDPGVAHDGEQNVTEREVGLMGVISWSGDEVTLISHGESDHWVLSGRVINPNVMELIGYETGEHAWISKKIAVRQ